MATRKRLKAKPTKRPVTPRGLKDLADAGLVAAKTIAILAAVKRGDRTVGFVGPPASAEGIVAAQDREED